MTHKILSRIQTGALAASAMFLMLSSPASAGQQKGHPSQTTAAKHDVPPAPPPAAKDQGPKGHHKGHYKGQH